MRLPSHSTTIAFLFGLVSVTCAAPLEYDPGWDSDATIRPVSKGFNSVHIEFGAPTVTTLRGNDGAKFSDFRVKLQSLLETEKAQKALGFGEIKEEIRISHDDERLPDIGEGKLDMLSFSMKGPDAARCPCIVHADIHNVRGLKIIGKAKTQIYPPIERVLR